MPKESGYWPQTEPAGPAEVYFFPRHRWIYSVGPVEALVRKKKITTEYLISIYIRIISNKRVGPTRYSRRRDLMPCRINNH